MEDDGFKLISRGKRRGKRFLERSSCLSDLSALNCTINIGSIRIDTFEELQQQLDKCLDELRQEGYLEQLRQSMSSCLENPLFIEIVCFGLGNFTRDISALYQMTLLKAMKLEFKYCDNLIVYDPVFTDFEKEALGLLGCNLLYKNTECRYPVNRQSTRPTLFFMPHMYPLHYNNIVHSNWNHLYQAVLYCNSFECITSTVIENQNHSEVEYLIKLKSGRSCYQVIECKVHNEFRLRDVFNNLSIHAFNGKSK